jgi:hypothetical protein
MATLRTFVTIGALLLGGASLALAQATSSSSSPPVPGPRPSEMSAPGAQQAMTMSAQEARTKLESAGYTSIGEVEADEDGYSATAMKDGKTVKIGVDSDGMIETLK